MKRTSILLVLLLAIIGGGGGLLLEALVVNAGRPMVIPPVSLPITLGAVAAGLLVFAIPIRRRLIGRSARPINPFVAVRVVAVAKASALTGALALGFGGGILVYFTTRPIPAPTESIWLTVATAVAGLVLAVAALVAEFLCMLPPSERRPPDDDGPDDSAAEPI